MPISLATQEAEIRRIVVLSQQIVCQTLSQKYPFLEKKAGGVTQGVDPVFKLQYPPPKKNCYFV
jgi:hypothetical protein